MLDNSYLSDSFLTSSEEEEVFEDEYDDQQVFNTRMISQQDESNFISNMHAVLPPVDQTSDETTYVRQFNFDELQAKCDEQFQQKQQQLLTTLPGNITTSIQMDPKQNVPLSPLHPPQLYDLDANNIKDIRKHYKKQNQQSKSKPDQQVETYSVNINNKLKVYGYDKFCTSADQFVYANRGGWIDVVKKKGHKAIDDLVPSKDTLERLDVIENGDTLNGKGQRVMNKVIHPDLFNGDYSVFKASLECQLPIAHTTIGDINRLFKYLDKIKQGALVAKSLIQMSENDRKFEYRQLQNLKQEERHQSFKHGKVINNAEDYSRQLHRDTVSLTMEYKRKLQLAQDKRNLKEFQSQQRDLKGLINQQNHKVETINNTKRNLQSNEDEDSIEIKAHRKKQNGKNFKQTSYMNIIMFITIIFSLFNQANAIIACPNKGKYLTFNNSKGSKLSDINVQGSYCQAKWKFNPNVDESISYMKIEKPCIYHVNNVTKMIIDSEQNSWHLYQYNNVLIEEGKLRFQFDKFMGVYSESNRIILQYQDYNTSMVSNLTATRLFEIDKFIEIIADSRTDVLIANKQFRLAHIMLNQTAGFYRWSNSLGRYTLEDGFVNCQKFENYLEENLVIDPKAMDFNNTLRVKGYNAYVRKFLEDNQAEVFISKPDQSSIRLLQESTTVKRKRILQSIDANWNNLQVKSDNTLIGCKISTKTDNSGNLLQSCMYRYLVEATTIGKIVKWSEQFSLGVIVPVAAEQYNMAPSEYDCLKAQAQYNYKCSCFFKATGYEYDDYFQKAETGISSTLVDYKNIGFLEKKDLEKDFLVNRKCMGQGGDGCFIAGNPRACVETKEKLQPYRSKLFKLQYAGVCALSVAIWKHPKLNQVQVSSGLSQCSNTDSYNAVKDFYNNTIYSMQNNEENILEDYVEAMQLSRGDYRSLNSKDFVLLADFIQGICPVKLDSNMNILFAKRKYQVKEVSCADDVAEIKEIDDFVMEAQNKTKNLFVFSRFLKVYKFNQGWDNFWPTQQGQPQIRMGDGNGQMLTQSIGDRLCTPQYAYCVNLRRFIEIYYCSPDKGTVDKIIIVDGGKDVSAGRFVVHTRQGYLICINLNNVDDTCDDIRYVEHAIRYVQRVTIDGMLEVVGLWAGMNQAEITAKDCKVNKPIAYSNGGITQGEICCINEGILKFTIDDGYQQESRSVNTVNKCYSFDTNAIFFKNINYETMVIKLPNSDGIINSNSKFTNKDFKPLVIQQTIMPQYNLAQPITESKWAYWMNKIILVLIIMLGWIILNGIAYAIDLHFSVTKGGDRAPSLWYLLLGGGIINIFVSSITKTKQYIFTKNQKKKLKVDKKLLKQFLKEQEEKTKLNQIEDNQEQNKKK